MWRSRLIIAAAFMALLPKVASATVYSFHDIETSALSSSPVSFTFSLDTATAVSTVSGTVFTDISIDENGTNSSGNSIAASFTTDLGSPRFFLIDTGSEPFYSGSGSGITFNIGSFSIADGFTDGEGTLNIAAGAASPVPEPATWTLLLAGCLTVAAAHRFSRKWSSSSRTLA